MIGMLLSFVQLGAALAFGWTVLRFARGVDEIMAEQDDLVASLQDYTVYVRGLPKVVRHATSRHVVPRHGTA